MFKKNQINNPIKNSYGFSLIEITVVISMVGIISAVGLSSLNNIRANSQLRVAQEKLLTDIKTAQNYALQGKIQPGNTVCGYGIHFKSDKKNYEIYYNKLDASNLTCEDQNKACKEQNKNSNHCKYEENYSTIIASKSLPKGVDLDDINSAELFFDIPHSNIFNSKGNPISPSDYTTNLTFGKSGGFGSAKTLTVTDWMSSFQLP